MKELIMEQVRELVIYGGLFLIIAAIAYIIFRRTDWKKIREAEMEEIIIESLQSGTAITAHPI